MYEIILSKDVEKFLDKLNSTERERIIHALEKLRIRPEAHLVRLVGEKVYKFRVGNYRLIVDLNKNELYILVIKIGHRKNIYKKSKTPP
ncbi:MAG: type II toxin-antitoxin system RelE/ParE family toxin [Nanoarchaeota archaeon]|nr:type II toxin-antitoxin system RelE/ParE family toxin [Nanoarchaeota archaeon]MBU1854324.1 type II toxin-antitoxin system RelE/ParE family toxin [Nanoarchaeota archaeon]